MVNPKPVGGHGFDACQCVVLLGRIRRFVLFCVGAARTRGLFRGRFRTTSQLLLAGVAVRPIGREGGRLKAVPTRPFASIVHDFCSPHAICLWHNLFVDDSQKNLLKALHLAAEALDLAQRAPHLGPVERDHRLEALDEQYAHLMTDIFRG